jgi:zinc D-Ala-D-Ala carboxypeptidase
MSDWSSPYFSEKELMCRCGCGQSPMDPEFVDRLTALREAYGPLRITSGFRCPQHPIEAKKSKAGSHASGKAVDIGVDREAAYEVLRLAIEMGFKRVGINQKGSGRFIHIDSCTAEDGFPEPTIWSY